jgi:hypothetical protein
VKPTAVEKTTPAVSVEDKVVQEMIDSQRQTFIAATTVEEQQGQQSNKVEQEPVGPWTQKLEELTGQEDIPQEQQSNEEEGQGPWTKKLEELSEKSVQDVPPIVNSPPQTSSSGTGYLDNLSQSQASTVESKSPPQANTGPNLRSLVQDMKPKRGPGSYLDSL